VARFLSFQSVCYEFVSGVNSVTMNDFDGSRQARD
jgi:hypothetical protein